MEDSVSDIKFQTGTLRKKSQYIRDQINEQISL